MSILIAEHDHSRYAELLRAAEPSLELRGSADPVELAALAVDCPI